jgi:hypothetical protein
MPAKPEPPPKLIAPDMPAEPMLPDVPPDPALPEAPPAPRRPPAPLDPMLPDTPPEPGLPAEGPLLEPPVPPDGGTSPDEAHPHKNTPAVNGTAWRKNERGCVMEYLMQGAVARPSLFRRPTAQRPSMHDRAVCRVHGMPGLEAADRSEKLG